MSSVLADYYSPSEKAGGPVQSLAALLHWTGENVDYTVLTRDRDRGDTTGFQGVPTGTWLQIPGGRCRYLLPAELRFRTLTSVVASCDVDVVYVNSIFSVPFGIYPMLMRRLGRFPTTRTVLATRGELNAGALSIHSIRKVLYLTFARLARLFDGVVLARHLR